MILLLTDYFFHSPDIFPLDFLGNLIMKCNHANSASLYFVEDSEGERITQASTPLKIAAVRSQKEKSETGKQIFSVDLIYGQVKTLVLYISIKLNN